MNRDYINWKGIDPARIVLQKSMIRHLEAIKPAGYAETHAIARSIGILRSLLKLNEAYRPSVEPTVSVDEQVERMYLEIRSWLVTCGSSVPTRDEYMLDLRKRLKALLSK